MLVIAGPGSGKTTVITQRIRYLTGHYGVPPGEILVITFTKAAADEMKRRYQKLAAADDIAVSFGTFHSIFFTILKHAYGFRAENILREDMRDRFFRDYLHTHPIEFEEEDASIRSLSREISLYKNADAPIAQYYPQTCAGEDFRKIYRAYADFLRRRRLLDFDDMLLETRRLLRERADYRRLWQDKFRYILIDEFQDINRIQYETIQLLAQPRENLFAVGDDDQSIYRFRGADPRIMLDFTSDYPGAKLVRLPFNYRSGSDIVRAGGNLIAHNGARYAKNPRVSAERPSAVIMQAFSEQRLENLYIIGELKKLFKEGVRAQQIAVLARTNAGLDDLAAQLTAYNIPFAAKEPIPGLYHHWVARDLFTYLHIAHGDSSRGSILKVMNRPNRYLTRELLPGGELDFDRWCAQYTTQPQMRKRLEKLRTDLAAVRDMRPFSAVNYIRRGIAYDDYLRAHARSHNIPEGDLFEVADAILERAKDFDTLAEWEEQITRTKQAERQRGRQTKQPEDAIALATYHGAKGLEYRVVFLPDLCAGISPHKKAVLEEDMEEERRMLYVAMTRAKEKLYVLTTSRIHNKDMLPSPFLQEIREAPAKDMRG